jgi:hypothetical protein
MPAAAPMEQDYAEQDMRLAERGRVAPPEHVATPHGEYLIGDADVAFWHAHGYLRIPQVFSDSARNPPLLVISWCCLTDRLWSQRPRRWTSSRRTSSG